MKKKARTVFLFAAFYFIVVQSCFGGKTPEDIAVEASELFDIGNPRKAVEQIQEGLKKFPKSSELYSQLSRFFEKTEDLEKAMEALKKALELKPGDQRIVDRIIILNQEIREKKLRMNFPVYSNPQEHRAMDLLKRAKAERNAGRLHEAFQKFIEAADTFPPLLDGKDLGFIVSGIEFYSRRMIIGDREAIFFHSVFTEFTGDLKAAEAGLEKFLSLEPKSTSAEPARNRLEKVKNILYTPPKKEGPDQPTLVASSPIGSDSGAIGSDSGQVASGGPAIVDSQLEEKIIGDLKSGIPERQILGIKYVRDSKKPSEAVVRALGACLELGDERVKNKAMDAISQIGPEASILLTEIESLFRGEDKKLKLKAFLVVGTAKLSPSEMIPTLINFFEDPDPETSNSAVRAVSKYGEEAIPLLQEFQEKRESQVLKDRAAMAIYLIRKGE